MPKIRITEKYEPTVNVPEEELSVYVPIETTSAVAIEAYRDVNTFVTKFSAVAKKTDNAFSKAFHMAFNLIKLGYTVVAEGLTAAPSDVTADVCDKYRFDLRFITSGDFGPASTENSFSAFEAKLISASAKRGDCVTLLNGYGKTGILTLPSTISEEDAEYAAVFYPNCDIKIEKFKELVSGKISSSTGEETMPAVYAYLVSFITSINKGNPEWLAVAGSVRGVVPNLVKPTDILGSADVDALQCRAAELDGANDNVGCAVNPICNINPYGYLIWGNRTFKLNEGTLTATSFLNVRNLISSIKKTVFIAAKRYTFEQNDDILWLNFTSAITPILDRMMSGSGIGGYKITKVKANAKARLAARIQIVPIEAVEDFDIEIEIVDSEF